MIQANLFDNHDEVLNKNHGLTFIDLFAGIGGFHLALHNVGAKCVFASELDKYARITYQKNFEAISPDLFTNELFNNDIRNLSLDNIPDFDILCAGFPCQPFSQAGLKLGFTDGSKSERGNLFFVIVDILEAKKPQAFILENVQHLLNHENGNTFKIIRQTIMELGYSFYYQVLKASDYGLPQHRPRVFMVGFLHDNIKSFYFPAKQKLKHSMSDVFNGDCNRKIGFTLRVGGKGSKIDDRRNWDCYLVDGNEVRIGVSEAKKMQGFPDSFEFPTSKTQAMKQLGNSIAVSVVEAVATQVIIYSSKLRNKVQDMPQDKNFNKSEWSELLVILKVILKNSIQIYDNKLESYQNKCFHILTIYGSNNITIQLREKSIEIFKNNILIYNQLIENILVEDDVNNLFNQVKQGVGTTFKLIDIPHHVEIDILPHLPIKSNSSNKSDLVLDIKNSDTCGIHKSGFSIKSQLGGYSTLINASSGTNFIYAVDDISLNSDIMNSINGINTRSKIKDRVHKIKSLGGNLKFIKTEKTVMECNLNLIDSCLTNYIAEILLSFYSGYARDINTLIMNDSKIYTGLVVREYKIKKFLSAFALGAFPSKIWNGDEDSNGFIILKKDGDIGALHILYRNELELYMLQNAILDTPSSTRHRFGILYKEGNKYFIKLNLQVRFKD